MKRYIFFLLLFLTFFYITPKHIQATNDERLGIHILSVTEIDEAIKLLKTKENKNDWNYVTVLLTLDDLNKEDEWVRFMKRCRKYHIVPIVRLATKARGKNWIRPNRKNLVDMIDFLGDLKWPSKDKIIIVFNEVNHAEEWGGEINPQNYASTLRFVSNWARTEMKEFIILPAALDLDAPNGTNTMEAFAYLDKLYDYDKEIFTYIDAWNSHSYPNPGFVSSPRRNGKNSMKGFIRELDYLRGKTNRDYKVFITETGWKLSYKTEPWLENYYTYCMQHIWSHYQVVAVTPFVLKGSPGPFSSFSFLDEQSKPTAHYEAFLDARMNVYDY